MEKISRLFIKAGMIYLAFSTILGLFIMIGPGFSFMHAHISLIGWLSFMVFGISYQVIPHYSGNRLFSQNLGIIHFWLANIGLIGLTLAYPVMRMSMLKGTEYSAPLQIVLIFGVIEAMSVFIFIINMWKSMREK